jgi:hypothetical protein
MRRFGGAGRAVEWCLLLFALAFALAVAGCSSTATKGGGQTVARLEDVRPAVVAVERLLGGPQRYTEIKVSRREVTLFVVEADRSESPYVYASGTLTPPPSSLPEDGDHAPFDLTSVKLAEVAGLPKLLGKSMPGASIAMASLVSNATDGLLWHLYVAGSKGSKFIVGVGVDGTTISGLLND